MPHLKVRPQPHLADVSAPQARKHAAAAPASQKVPQAGSPGKDASPARTSARIRVAGALPPARIPPEALASPRGDRLFATALTMSLALHGVVLALHFTPLDPLKLFDNEPPLEVTLVNAKSQTKPSKAELLAQANLDGGGNNVAKRRAKTPLQLPTKETPAKNLSVEAAAPQRTAVAVRRERRPAPADEARYWAELPWHL